VLGRRRTDVCDAQMPLPLVRVHPELLGISLYGFSDVSSGTICFIQLLRGWDQESRWGYLDELQ
jgi:hypothetical protein